MNIEHDEQTSISEMDLEANYWVFQKPESVNLIFESTGKKSGLLQVSNSTGAMIFANKIQLNQGTNSFEISNHQLDEGLLIFQLLVENENHIQKAFISF